MGKSKFLRKCIIVGPMFMILLIIIYWDDEGAAYFNLHTPISGPHAVGSKGSSSWPDTDAFLNQSLQKTRDDKNPKTFGLSFPSEDDGKQEDRYITEEMKKRQDNRKQLIRDLCGINSTLNFSGKRRTFNDIPSSELNHLIIDNHHRIIYCYVPKVACSHWKRIMIVLNGSVLENGKPYRDPEAIPSEYVHSNKYFLTFSQLSRDMMTDKLQKYTKFLFVRDPFVRLISAYKDKIEKPREYFYKLYSTVMLKRYSNYSKPPASVFDAYKSGMRPSFSHFVQYLLDPRSEEEEPFNEHWQQIYRLCHPCQIDYDFIGKLETVNEDVEHLLHSLNLDDFISFAPAYENKTVSSMLQDWFSKIPYESIRKLYELYEPDFKLFGYPKPEKTVT